MTDAPTNVVNMQAKARLIREAREAREKRRAEHTSMPHAERLAKHMAKVRAGEIEGVTIETSHLTPKDRKGDPDFPGIPELAHFYKPPSTCEICGSISAPGAKVCLTCAVASEVDDTEV